MSLFRLVDKSDSWYLAVFMNMVGRGLSKLHDAFRGGRKLADGNQQTGFCLSWELKANAWLLFSVPGEA